MDLTCTPRVGKLDPLEIRFHGNQTENTEFRFSNGIPNTEMSLYNPPATGVYWELRIPTQILSALLCDKKH